MAEFSIAVRRAPVTGAPPFSFAFGPVASPAETGFSDLEFSSRAEGGYHRASFNLTGHPESMSELLTLILGGEVLIYDELGAQVWEGYIHDLELDGGRVQYQASIADMANAVWVRYRVRGSTTTSRSAVATDDASIARYGRREFVLSAGELESSDIPDAIAVTYLNTHAWPEPSPVSISPRREVVEYPVMQVGCRGWFDTLNWCCYNQTVSTDSQAAAAQVQAIMADTNVAQFVASAEYETNATLVSKEYDADRRGGDIINDIARLGDAFNNRFLARMVKGRKFVFALASPPTEAA